MSFTVKATSGGGGREVPPAGSHPAVLVAIVDLGTHTETYKDQAAKSIRKVLLCWELTDEKVAGKKDENHLVCKDFSLTFGTKSGLRKIVEGWRGKAFAEGEDFDLGKLLGKECMLTISIGTSSKGNEYAKIESVSPKPKGMTVPPAQRKPLLFEVGQDTAQLEWIPYLYGEAVATVIGRSHEARGTTPPPSTNGNGNGHANGNGQPVTASAESEEIPF